MLGADNFHEEKCHLPKDSNNHFETQSYQDYMVQAWLLGENIINCQKLHESNQKLSLICQDPQVNLTSEKTKLSLEVAVTLLKSEVERFKQATRNQNKLKEAAQKYKEV
jgi:hypothetical protein